MHPNSMQVILVLWQCRIVQHHAVAVLSLGPSSSYSISAWEGPDIYHAYGCKIRELSPPPLPPSHEYCFHPQKFHVDTSFVTLIVAVAKAKVWLHHIYPTPKTMLYRSVPLIRPPILYTTSSPKRGGGVFSSTQLVSIIRPLKKFRYVYDTAKVRVHSYRSTNDRQYCSWSSCVVSLHRREELHFNSRAITFTTTSL